MFQSEEIQLRRVRIHRLRWPIVLKLIKALQDIHEIAKIVEFSSVCMSLGFLEKHGSSNQNCYG